MIGTLRNCRICTRGGLLAAILVAAVFASSQVTCLTHTHCDESDCFDSHGESFDSHGHSHDDHDSHHESDGEPCSSCDDEHHDLDIHHHSHDGKTHPQRRFTAPADDAEFAGEVSEETPVFTLAEYLPAIDESPPLERYGLTFAERAPPLS